jgi:hypothetical protein
VQSKADPCLLFRKDEKLGTMVLAAYVDDNYVIGNDEIIQDTIEKIKKSGFGVTVEDTLTDYLSCKILFNNEKTKAWLGQPHLIKKLERKFGSMVSNLQKYRTPGTPGKGVLRPKSEDEKVSIDEQALYRSGVGMLLYLVKHSRPDIANATRELSKCMDGATPAALKELFRVIKFVLDTRNFGLRIEPKGYTDFLEWVLVPFTDSDWSGDKDNRLSVSGFIMLLLGVPILWRSRAQRSVSLSSSEGEYKACSEAAQEVKFVYYILESIGRCLKRFFSNDSKCFR